MIRNNIIITFLDDVVDPGTYLDQFEYLKGFDFVIEYNTITIKGESKEELGSDLGELFYLNNDVFESISNEYVIDNELNSFYVDQTSLIDIETPIIDKSSFDYFFDKYPIKPFKKVWNKLLEENQFILNENDEWINENKNEITPIKLWMRFLKQNQQSLIKCFESNEKYDDFVWDIHETLKIEYEDLIKLMGSYSTIEIHNYK